MNHWRFALLCLAFTLLMAFCGHENVSERERRENFRNGAEYPWVTK